MRRSLSLLTILAVAPVMIATSPPDIEGGMAFTAYGEQEGPGFLLDAEHPVARFRITAEVTLTEAARGQSSSGNLVVGLGAAWAGGDPEGSVALYVGEEEEPRWAISLGSLPVDAGARTFGLEQDPFAEVPVPAGGSALLATQSDNAFRDCAEDRACRVEVEATLRLLDDAFVELRPHGHATIWTEMPESAELPDELPPGAWLEVAVEVVRGG